MPDLLILSLGKEQSKQKSTKEYLKQSTAANGHHNKAIRENRNNTQ
jgi:hypothetical protein